MGKAIVTGGAGFIGCNAARRLLTQGYEVVVVDNLSRPGGPENLEWLRSEGPVRVEVLDVSRPEAVARLFRRHDDANLVLHLAAQVAVTDSLRDPRADFEANLLGTFNVLEAMRGCGMRIPLIYASTNKVYGSLAHAPVVERRSRYEYVSLPWGVSEDARVDPRSPYGCSKAGAEQYVRDYHRMYGIPGVVFRQSCVYGPRQFGTEEQGWVAWLMVAARLGYPLTVFGDGKQVRDVLYVDDLLDAYEAAGRAIGVAAGQVYNIGGGPENVVSIGELLAYLEDREQRPLAARRAPWRPDDQRVYVSDIRHLERDLAWTPKTSWHRGREALYEWIVGHEGAIGTILGKTAPVPRLTADSQRRPGVDDPTQ